MEYNFKCFDMLPNEKKRHIYDVSHAEVKQVSIHSSTFVLVDYEKLYHNHFPQIELNAKNLCIITKST